ncbi:MAG: hypothetical protein DRI86_05500 [Bacteroidetes bacterium]|nr:MAG: hypothetical protein DRI86_05500 [Bacteroidota bacterium]
MKLKLNSKLMVSILGVTIFIFVLSLGYMAFIIKPIRLADMEKTAASYAGKYANLVRSYLTEEIKVSRTMADQFETMQSYDAETKLSRTVNIQTKIFSKYPYYQAIWMSWERSNLSTAWKKNYGRIRINIFKSSDKVVIERDSMNTNGDTPGSLYLQLKTSKSEFLTEPYTDVYDGESKMVASVASPVVINGRYAGLCGIDIPMSRFNDIINEAENIYSSNIFLISNKGIYVGNKEHNELVGKSIINDFSNTNIDIKSKIKEGKPFSTNLNIKNEGDFYYTFYPFTIAGTSHPWMVGVAVPREVIINQTNSNFRSSFLVGGIGIILLIIVIFFISKNITNPLSKITNSLELLSKGKINSVKELNIKRNDEIGDIANSSNTLINNLTNTAHFAREIGKGDLDAKFKALSEEDVLGNALIEMRDSLQRAREEEETRRKNEEEQKWATVGFAKFGELLRNNTDNMESFTYNVISKLVKYTNSNQGTIFLVNNEDDSDTFLEMSSCYAYDRKKFVDKKIQAGENLVGQCYLEAQTIHMTDIPDNYVSITSGLGDANPRSLLITPLSFNDNVYGVIEMASFNKFSQYQIDFIEKVAESIASTISSVKVNIKTVTLLEESKLKSEELAAQEEEMRQNMEELQTTQEESARREIEMNGVLSALNTSYLVGELDINANILNLNENALELLGISKEKAEGHNLRSFIQDSELDKFNTLWEKVKNGETAKRQSVVNRAKGKVVITESYSPILDEMDEIYKVLNIGIEVDIDFDKNI